MMEEDARLQRSGKRPPIRSFRDLEVYVRARDARRDAYALARRLPADQRFNLISQVQSASDSIPARIAEGWGKRASAAEFKRFLQMALGSATEMQSHLDSVVDIGCASAQEVAHLNEQFRVIGAQLTMLIRNWRTYEGPPPTATPAVSRQLPPSIVHSPSSRRKDTG
jgi:four helix bundle protein